jgi:uncharacterized protein CbrC (UPF0167 family)
MRAETLPSFKYHPNPLATGAFEASAEACECCGEARGYAYTGNVYSIQEVKVVCPWCIADGRVARTFNATLNEDFPLRSEGLSETIIDEVTRRTPGYISWQGDWWIACCNDACELHGDAPAQEIQALDDTGRIALSRDSGFSVNDLTEILEHYEPGGSPAFYKFVCRHCGITRYRGDCD